MDWIVSFLNAVEWPTLIGVAGIFVYFRQIMKKDLQALRSELKGEIQELRSDLKGEIQELRSELKREMQDLRVEVKTDIGRLSDKIDNVHGRLCHLEGAFAAKDFCKLSYDQKEKAE